MKKLPMSQRIPIATLVAGSAIIPLTLFSQEARTTWRDYLGGSDSSHYSALKQINTRNVDKLETAWSFETGDEITYLFSPVVVDNIAYVAAKNGALVAL